MIKSCLQAFAALALASVCCSGVEAESTGWWPAQATPKGIVRTQNRDTFPAPRRSWEMTIESLAGLAAKAVNEAHGDEMVWVAGSNVDQEDWLARRLRREPRLESLGAFSPEELIERFAKRGIVKGYILYRADQSQGKINQHRPGMDCSANVATSLAGLLDGIIVDESLEKIAQKLGLKLLLDARDKSQEWVFETYRDRFTRKMLCTMDPRNPNVRDFAIAQKALTVYGYDQPVPAAMEWLDPLSPILGWNGGNELTTTEMSSRWGHIQTATDWCANLPVLMAGSATARQPRVASLDPRKIDWKDTRSAISFVNTDGDNVQWYEGNFFRGREGNSYWGSPERGKIPFGWSCPFAHLAQLCPDIIDYAVDTRTPNDWFIEWGGGYYYPEMFGSARAKSVGIAGATCTAHVASDAEEQYAHHRLQPAQDRFARGAQGVPGLRRADRWTARHIRIPVRPLRGGCGASLLGQRRPRHRRSGDQRAVRDMAASGPASTSRHSGEGGAGDSRVRGESAGGGIASLRLGDRACVVMVPACSGNRRKRRGYASG